MSLPPSSSSPTLPPPTSPLPFLKDAHPCTHPLQSIYLVSREQRWSNADTKAPRPWTPLVGGGDAQQQQQRASHRSPAASAAAGPPSNPWHSVFSRLVCSCSLSQQHNGGERDGGLQSQTFFMPAARGCCKTPFLAAGRGRRIRLEMGGGGGWGELGEREALGTATLKHK